MIRKEGIKEKEQELSLYCSKTVDYKKFEEFIRVKHETTKKTKNFYQEKVMRKFRWRKCIGRKRTDDNFLNKMEKKFGKKEEIAIVIGDWNNRNRTKGLESTMGRGLKKTIARRFETYQVNEFRTSKKCCNCLNDLKVMEKEERRKNKDGEIKITRKKIRIQGCSYCVGKSRKEEKPEKKIELNVSKNGKKSILAPFKLLTRDKNSCLNMLNIVRHIINSKDHSRPEAFRREEKILPVTSTSKPGKKQVILGCSRYILGF
jgi:hypothetical protein